MDPLDVVGTEPAPLAGFAYTSTPAVPFTDRDLSDLLLAARRWNAQYGVTGKLVVREDGDRVVAFAQWLEGPPDAVAACVRRVVEDPRHGAFEVRFRGAVPSRRFPDWDMALVPTDDAGFGPAADALAEADGDG